MGPHTLWGPTLVVFPEYRAAVVGTAGLVFAHKNININININKHININ